MKNVFARALALSVVALAAALIGTSTAGATGFTLKYAVPSGVASSFAALDPATATNNQVQWQALYMTCANLYNHPDVDLQKGGQAVPEVSAGPPAVSPDGLVYTFTLKTGYKFSDGTAVTPSAYATEINRVKTLTDASFAKYAADITNVSANNAANTLTITLSAPDADLPDRLAMPIFCAVPPSTPATAQTSVPASGPYMIGTTSAGSALTLVRNPYYTGTRPRNPDQIELIAAAAPVAAASIDDGTYDVTDQLSSSDFSAAGTTWGPGSSNAVSGNPRFFVSANNGLNYLALNTTAGRALANVNLRLAVNYALDRNALAGLASPYAQTPWSQYLTPGIPGFISDTNAFPLSPDQATASGLMGGAGPPLTIWCSGTVRCNQANTIATELQTAGFGAITVVNKGGSFFTDVASPTANFDIAITGWIADFVDPGNIIVPLLHKGSANNLSHWDSDTWTDTNAMTATARMDAASALLAPDRYTAFGQLATELPDAAPIAVLSYTNWRYYFSPRIGCQTINPQYGIALGSLCLPEVADQPVAAGGTVTSPTSDPVAAAVTSPVAGTVSITETPTLNDVAPSGYTFFGQQVTIEAPQATQDTPLVLSFTVDSSVLNGADPNSVTLFRNGVPIDPCTTSSGAYPDPCVVRPPTANGTGYTYTVRTSHASRWNFGRKFNFSSFAQPVDPRPTYNTMRAGSAVPVKFGLGGNLGLDVFTQGYPKSVAVVCGSGSTPTDAIEQTVTAGSSSLSYDATTNQYSYVWKTDKAWAGTCRQLILRFGDGSEQRANFQFTK